MLRNMAINDKHKMAIWSVISLLYAFVKNLSQKLLKNI